jgi:hypothetical protein
VRPKPDSARLQNEFEVGNGRQQARACILEPAAAAVARRCRTGAIE